MNWLKTNSLIHFFNDMANNKTTETAVNVEDFINNVADPTKREDSLKLIEIIKNKTGFAPKMWGPSIVGFGSYHYKYASGHEGDSPLVAFSPRASSIVLYLSASFEKREKLLENFGKYKTEKSCIYIKKLADINLEILQEMMENHIKYIRKVYPEN